MVRMLPPQLVDRRVDQAMLYLNTQQGLIGAQPSKRREAG